MLNQCAQSHCSRRFDNFENKGNLIIKLRWEPAHKGKGERSLWANNTRRLLWNYPAFDFRAGLSGWKDGNSCFVDFSPIMEEPRWIKSNAKWMMDSSPLWNNKLQPWQFCTSELQLSFLQLTAISKPLLRVPVLMTGLKCCEASHKDSEQHTVERAWLHGQWGD